jgi:F5/8 type C domain/Calcineurin-like phosphoesterase
MRHKKSKLIANFCCSYRCLSLTLICFILFSAGENNKYALFKFVNAQYDPFQDFSSPQKPLKANTNNETRINTNAEIKPKADQNKVCAPVSAVGVNALGSQVGNPASNAIDKNLNTRWSNEGLGSWIQIDLGEKKVVCGIEVNWYSGNTRVVSFDVSLSDDGNNFVKVFSGNSGKTLSEENYNFTDESARYVRITVTKNTQNNWASISELKVNGYSSSTEPGPGPQPGPTNCANLQISNVSASGSQAGFPASNAVDKNINTLWSKFGLGSWIQIDLGQQKVVCSLDISWYKGNERINTFTISVSNDGNSFTNIYSTRSNGATITETYDIPDVVARYLRITVNGNTQNNWVSIGDINIKGFSKEQGSAFNFVAVGDWSCNSMASETINQIVQKQPEIVLALGDLSYTNSPKCWLDEIQPINDITRITIGNHDSAEEESSALEKEYLSHFNLARPFYSFDYQNVHFLMLSTQLEAVKGDEQYNFAESDLKQATSNPNTDWIIVAFHKPLYTSPSTHAAEIDFRNVYHPLFDQYNVDLVLQAHNHNYQRSYPISYNQNGDQPSITDINKSTYNDPKGEIFVIAGTGGKSLYDIKSKSPFTVSQFEDYGILEVAISEASQLTGTFYTNDGNKILDTFTIVK